MTSADAARLEATVGRVSPDAFLDAVVDISDDAIFTCDRDGRISSWSATAVRLFGCTASDAVGAGLPSLWAAHLREEVQSVIARVAAGDRIQHFESEVVRADGMPMPASLSLCPILDADGRATGIVVVARDITEQRVTQATLAEVEARLQEGEALAHVGSWLWDLRTGTVQWSQEFHRIHGIDPLDFDGTFESHLVGIVPDDRGRVRTAMEASVRSGRAFESEYQIFRSDGEVRQLHVRAQPTMGSAGHAVGLRGIGQDVTHRPAPADGPEAG
jgi:PAS domain S-box-containing protein